jgi:hypothetical protein
MGSVFLAETAVFREGKLFFHFLLIALRIVCNTATRATLELRHVVFNLSHTFGFTITINFSLSTLREKRIFVNTEPLIGIEPMTSSLPRTCSAN